MQPAGRRAVGVASVSKRLGLDSYFYMSSFGFVLSYLLFVCSACACAMVCLWRSEESFQESFHLGFQASDLPASPSPAEPSGCPN